MVAVITLDLLHVEPEFLAQQHDVVFLAREEDPSGRYIEFLPVFRKHLRRIVFGIDAD